MNFFPYHNFNIISPLSPPEAEARLYSLVTPDYSNPLKVKYPEHSGEVANGRFKIEKINTGRHGPLTSFKGYIVTTDEGCSIKVKVSPAGWSLFPVLFFLLLEMMLIEAMSRNGDEHVYKVVLIVTLCGYFLLNVLVKYETGVYRRILLKALNARLASKPD